MSKLFLLTALVAILGFSACNKKTSTQKTPPPKGKVVVKDHTTTAPAPAATATSSQLETDLKLIKEYIKANNLKKVESTASGIHYVIENPGSGAKPTLKSTVKCHYKGTLLDGTEFDSSYKRNAPIDFPLTGVIKGWQEAIPLLAKGGKGKFIIPSELAYGSKQVGASIKPNSVLVFDVELLDVK
jgi:FKBP-type peptidyl-prolyl cis-trans isomerase